MEIIESLQWRYATKKFDNTQLLPQSKIDILTEAFNLTATSYGLQPLKLIVLNNKELQKKLVPHSFEQQQVVDASHLLIICIEKNIDENYINRYFDSVKNIRGTEESILAPFRAQVISSFGNKTQDQIRTWAAKQAYIALGNLLTVCATEQIDACPMEGFIPEQYDKELQLDELGLTATLVLPVGYRDENDLFSKLEKVRRPLSETIINF